MQRSWIRILGIPMVCLQFVIAAPVQALGEEADLVLEEIRQLAREADPDMSELEGKLELWLNLKHESQIAKPQSVMLRTEGEQISNELKALLDNKAPAAEISEKLREGRALSQRFNMSSVALYGELREALAPLQTRYLEEVEDWFASEQTKNCLTIAANDPFANLANSSYGHQSPLFANALQSPLIVERLHDRRSKSPRADSQFVCAFLIRATETVQGLFKTIDLSQFPELAERFGWVNGVVGGASPEEWMIFDGDTEAVSLNVAEGRIVISQPMAEALVDAVVVEVFRSYEALEETCQNVGNQSPAESVLQTANVMQEKNQDPQFREEFFRKMMGTSSPEEMIKGAMLGQQIEMESNPLVLFGDANHSEQLSQLLAFALFHEMGHIALGHDHKRNPACGSMHNMEYAADEFAASILAKQQRGVAGINRKREVAGLETFYRRFNDFGFANDVNCPHPPIEARFQKLQAAYHSTRAVNDDQSLKGAVQQLQQPKNMCGAMPASFQAKCEDELHRSGVFE